MIGFKYLVPAEQEMAEAAVFYEEKAKGLGVEFLNDVKRAINRIQENPYLGETLRGNFRRCLLSRFPFSLIYTVETEGILIIALAHHSRHPNYWKNRT